MTDREKVISNLEQQIGWIEYIDAHKFPGGGHTVSAMRQAIALLKEFTAKRETFRVIDSLTGEEADTYEIALHEDWAKKLCYCDMEGWAIEDDGSLLLVDECGQFEYADRERFKVIWDD